MTCEFKVTKIILPTLNKTILEMGSSVPGTLILLIRTALIQNTIWQSLCSHFSTHTHPDNKSYFNEKPLDNLKLVINLHIHIQRIAHEGR